MVPCYDQTDFSRNGDICYFNRNCSSRLSLFLVCGVYRSGLIRVREFTMAEIEHFCDPADKSHPKFGLVETTELVLYSASNQMGGEAARLLSIGEAVQTGLVANQAR